MICGLDRDRLEETQGLFWVLARHVASWLESY